MSKHLKQTIMLVVALIVVLSAAIFYNVKNNDSKSSKKADQPVPTLYVNGANTTTNAANHLLTIGDRDGGTQSLKITFDKQGDPVYKGKLTKKTSQPLIKVTFNPKTSVFYQERGLYHVLQHLKSKYDYDNYNIVGFGGGAVAALAVASDKDTSIPDLSELISIGAGYNGIMKVNDKANSNHLSSSGKPLIMRKQTAQYPSYKELSLNTKTLPKDVKILNIYGNSAGKGNNDGVITTNSAESLKYLVHERTDSYQGVKLTGSDASHNGLNNHPVVDRLVERSLFDKC
ncbi:alpha/beta hydrolase [Nicoliella lavandulae]|uniref:Alpha/beta hydrolase n=1 Tax=Nicoliella lavandulae TaxID=3082954 RepID=A0ABU8SKN0_9LACO